MTEEERSVRIDVPVGQDLDAEFWDRVRELLDQKGMPLAQRRSADLGWTLLEPGQVIDLSEPVQLNGLHPVRPQTSVELRADHAYISIREIEEPGKYVGFPFELRTAIEEVFFGPRDSIDVRPPVQVAIFVVELKKEVTPKQILEAAKEAMPGLTHPPLEMEEDTEDWAPFSMHELVEIGTHIECERFSDPEEASIYVHFKMFVDYKLLEVSSTAVDQVEAAGGALAEAVSRLADGLLINVVRPSRPPGTTDL